MSRASCLSIIELVRRLVNDSDYNTYDNDEIQDALDVLRWEGRYLRLDAVPTRASGGVTTYVTFNAPQPWGYWETDSVIYDNNFDPLTPSSSDWTAGRWTFSTEPTRQVTILGWSHDPYGAAAEILTQRGAALAEEIQSFSSVNGSFTYANKRSGPLQLAAKYKRMSRAAVGTGQMYRSDVNIY